MANYGPPMKSLRLLASGTLLFVIAASSVSPASAQSVNPVDPFADDPSTVPFGGSGDDDLVGPTAPTSGRLRVSLELKGSGHDVVAIRTGSELDDASTYNLARSVGDALGLERDNYEVVDPAEQSLNTDPEDQLNLPDAELHLDGRLVKQYGDSWNLRFETQDLLRITGLYGFESVALGVCPMTEEVKDQSTVPASNPNDDGCRVWQQDADAEAITIDITEVPDSSGYWRDVLILALVAVAIAAIGSLVVIFCRIAGKLRSVNTATLVAVGLLTLAGCVAWLVAVVAVATNSGPLNEFVLSVSGGRALLVMAVVLPALLPGLAFIMPAAMLAMGRVHVPAPPSTDGFTPSASGPGVPSWLQGAVQSSAPSSAMPAQTPSPSDTSLPSWMQKSSQATQPQSPQPQAPAPQPAPQPQAAPQSPPPPVPPTERSTETDRGPERQQPAPAPKPESSAGGDDWAAPG